MKVSEAVLLLQLTYSYLISRILISHASIYIRMRFISKQVGVLLFYIVEHVVYASVSALMIGGLDKVSFSFG